jgi:dTDP-4-amino-4,6-dideoxygalactose transaminase
MPWCNIQNQNVGTIGHIGTFSFYPANHITMGEGGAVVTNDPVLYKIIRSFRDWAETAGASREKTIHVKKDLI